MNHDDEDTGVRLLGWVAAGISGVSSLIILMLWGWL